MKTVRDWLNETAFSRCLKAKFFRIVSSDGKQLFDQLEARKYPEFTDITPVLRMVVTNVEETKGYYIVTARKLEDLNLSVFPTGSNKE